jgi:hypothetical protein
MIRIGTLCLLLADHSLAGRTCTVAGPLAYYKGKHKASGKARTGYAYPIKVPGDARFWVSFPRHLVPLAPPS